MEQRISELTERLEGMGRLVDRHEAQLGGNSAESKKDEMVRQIMQEIKQNIPVVTGNNDVYEHIFNLKL